MKPNKCQLDYACVELTLHYHNGSIPNPERYDQISNGYKEFIASLVTGKAGAVKTVEHLSNWFGFTGLDTNKLLSLGSVNNERVG